MWPAKQLFLAALLFYYQDSDATITDWTVPPISGSADGSGVISVNEDQSTYFIFDDINAVSDTSGSAHCCTYTYVTQESPFSVLTDGSVQITSALDYETRQSYTVVVEAEDTGGAFGTVTVTFSVVDINEATPVFAESTYTACAANGSVADTVVITVQATDGDTNNTVSYSILPGGNTNSDFKIDATTGDVQVNTAKTLDESVTASYSLVVEATDDGSPLLTGSTTVSVTVGGCSSATCIVVSIATVLISFIFVWF